MTNSCPLGMTTRGDERLRVRHASRVPSGCEQALDLAGEAGVEPFDAPHDLASGVRDTAAWDCRGKGCNWDLPPSTSERSGEVRVSPS